MHGVFFNPAGTIGIGTGYYFDLHAVTLFRVSPATGHLTVEKQVPLVAAGQKRYGAFAHFVTWRDDRYALTGTQQGGRPR